MGKDSLYYEGYLAGYWDGVKDAVSFKVQDCPSVHNRTLPIHAMALSTRAYNCLTHCGCVYIEDVAALNKETIRRIRNLGTKTASEIANCLIEYGILYSAWSDFL